MKFVLVDKNELASGEREESEEHNMSQEDAERTALQHLTKKNPHYYSIAASVGLEEESLELNEQALLEYKKGFDQHPQAGATKGNSKDAGLSLRTKRKGRLGPFKDAEGKFPFFAGGR